MRGARLGHRDRRRSRDRRAAARAASGSAGCSPVRVYGDDLPVHKPDPGAAAAALERARPRRSARRDGLRRRRPDDMRMARAVGRPGVGDRVAPRRSGRARRGRRATRSRRPSRRGSTAELDGRAHRVSAVARAGDGRDRPAAATADRASTPSSSRTARSPRAPPSTRPGRAGTTASSLVVAADGGARPRRGDSASRSTSWSATATRSTRRSSRELRAAGIPIERSPPTRTRPTPSSRSLAAIARGATRVTILGAFGGPRLDHALANVWLLGHPALGGRTPCLLDARVAHPRCSTPTARPGDARRSPGAIGRPRLAAPVRRRRRRRHDRRPALPARRRDAPPGPARGLSNVRLARRRRVDLRRGRLLIVEVPVDAACR